VGEVITVDDLEGALKQQDVAVTEGDVVLLRTGDGQLWMKDNDAFTRGEPGLGMAAAARLWGRKSTPVGSGTRATQVVPPEDKERPFEVHQLLLVRNGVYNLENLDLEELARDKVYEFAFIFAPLRLKGASGSPGNPVAVRGRARATPGGGRRRPYPAPTQTNKRPSERLRHDPFARRIAGYRPPARTGAHRSVSFKKASRWCFHTAALVCVPWPTVSSLSGIMIARPCSTRLISFSSIPSSGGL